MRTSLCLRSYDNYKNIKKDDIHTTYFNKYFNKNMDLNVCDFYWACSRKSYLPCGQVCDVYSYDSIRLALLAGACLINLDIYSDDNGLNPIVRDERPMPQIMSGLRTSLDFEQCIKIIKKFAWIDNVKYPLILYLNIHTNSKIVINNMAKMLYKIFNGYFINKRYSYARVPFGQIPIKELLGNVAIITDKYPTINIFDELVNGYINNKEINLVNYFPSTEAFGGIISKYGNKSDPINNNRFNVTIINSVQNINKELKNSAECIAVQNFRNPKSDIYNADPTDCWKYGMQLVLMNYQLYDKNMEKYINKFKEAGLILKPDELRYIPQPKKPLLIQNKNASYEPRTIGVKGWYSYNI